MTLSDLSIRRPVLAGVVSLLVVVFGLASIDRIPIRELPDIDATVVSVTTAYPGASPAIVDTDVTEVIESAIAGVSGVKTIASQSRRSRSLTTIEFVTGRNIDEAANDVRDAVGRVRARLPEDADDPRIIKRDDDADPVMRLAVTSSRMAPAQITDYIERFLLDRLATVDGVAGVDIYGERRFAVRIWLDRRALAARNLTVADVEAALRRNNVELPAGDIESLNRQLTMRLDSRIASVDQFARLVIARAADYPVRLGDVARVERAVADDKTFVRANGVVAVGLGVTRQSNANTIAISEAVRAEIDVITPTLPEGMAITVGSDDATFIAASIREVLIALGLSLTLVVLVILIFLGSARATLVPAVTIPVALIGCFIIIHLLGFSINVLTLLALLLAIGLVVDDAIVVLENIKRRLDLGESPLVACSRGTRQVTFAVIATSLTLIAVFIPISFLEGQAGRLFTEFGFVMASAVAISTLVALSLCPVLSTMLLGAGAAADAKDAPPRPAIGRFGALYRQLLERALGARLIVIVLAAAFAAGSYGLYPGLARELAPKEDRGRIFLLLSAPQGSTSSYTDAEVRNVERALQPMVEDGLIRVVYSIVGSWGRPDRAFMVLRLPDWEERTLSDTAIARRIRPIADALTGARGFPSTPTGLGLRGSRSPLRVVIGGPNYAQVKDWAKALLARAEENPGLVGPEMDFEQNQAQLDVHIDRARADDLGISVEEVGTTLQTMFASREVTQFIERGRAYPVLIQADAEDRRTPGDISNIFVRAGDGETLVPLSALVEISESASAPTLRRYNRLPSVIISSSLAQDYSLGEAIEFMEKAAAETLPDEARLALTGPSQQFRETSSGVAVTFALAILIVFLVLAAQFESFIHPVVIMLSVPLAVAGAIYALSFSGISLNIYSQIGIILLIGLMAKNGILIVEFANQLRDQGRSVREAVIEASVLRVRPIVMTVVSTMLGAVPLVLALGAGAEARIAIGTVVIGGLGLASVLTLFLTPVLYDLMAGATRPRGAIEKALEAELGSAGATVLEAVPLVTEPRRPSPPSGHP